MTYTKNPDGSIQNAEGTYLYASLPITAEWQAYLDWESARKLSGIAFLTRVTDAEYTAVVTAAQTDVKIARWLDTVRVQGEVDLTIQAAADAKAYLVSKNLLTQERADVVFAFPQ